MIEHRPFPPALAAMSRTEFDYADGDGIDFEPYDAFLTAEDTADWLRSWTGNKEFDAGAYLPFGQDGTGGTAAVWCVRVDRPLVDQPIVFLGSEGATGVVAGCLSDFLWVLADGLGPMEAVEYDDRPSRPNAPLTALAEAHATTPRRPARTIITEAGTEFPTFSEDIEDLCR